MSKKKVTLSVDSKVYSDFQRYCEENAILLSKRVELFMKSILKNKKSFVILSIFVFMFSLIFNLGIINAFAGGNGTLSNPYQISNWTDLNSTRLNLTASYILINNLSSLTLDYNGIGNNWIPIGNTTTNFTFNGRFNGNNFTISNLTIKSTTDFTGLFGYSGGIFSNLGLINVNVFSTANNVGALVGGLSGSASSITNSYSTGYVNGSTNVGGLVGLKSGGSITKSYSNSKVDGHGDNVGGLLGIGSGASIIFNNDYATGNVNTSGNNIGGLIGSNGGSIINSYATGYVSSSGKGNNIGGLIGSNGGSIINSYSTGNIYGNQSIGGLIGSNSGANVTNSYSTGYVNGSTNVGGLIGFSNGSVTNSYWDNETSGQIISAGGTGETTVQMKSISTFSNWNISIGSANLNSGFPYLAWQTNNNSFIWLLNIPPKISIIYPVNQNYTSNVSSLNYSISDNDLLNCWYSLNNGITNTSIACGSNVAGLSANQGSNFWSVYASDSVGNINSSSIAFFVDSIPPNINIFSPQNINYTGNSIFLNYSATDSNGVSSCWYSMDASPNITLAGCPTASISGIIDGAHVLMVYTNDTFGNINSNSVQFITASIPPQWSNMQSNIVSSYSSSTPSTFNITWNSVNSVSSVLFESNFTGSVKNYTMYSLGGNVYGFNATLPTGTFYWKSYANDTFGNLNASTSSTFTIGKASNPVDLYLNGNKNKNVTITYGDLLNATATSLASTAIYRENSLISNPSIEILSANTNGYNYTIYSPGNQNYSQNSSTFYLFVNKQPTSLVLSLNGLSRNINLTYGIGINSTSFGVNGTSSIYLDNSLITNGNSIFLGAGVHNYTAVVESDQNHTGSSTTYFASITKAVPSLSLLINNFQNNLTITYGTNTNVTAYENNSGDNDVVYSLYNNNNLVNSGSLVQELTNLGAGNYTYLFNTTEGENYSSDSKELRINVNKGSPNLALLINNFDSDISIPVGQVVNISAYPISPTNSNLSLYEDGSLVATDGNISITRNYSSVGTRVFSAIIAETQNYTEGSKNHSIDVIDPDAPQYSLLTETPFDPGTYSKNQIYYFNSTWTDNIGVDNVIIQFDNVNYSYSQGQLTKKGNIYSFNISNLASRIYNYNWHANDTSNNVISTSLQTYTINPAITALFLTFTPNNNVNYGTNVTVSCVANNQESSLSLTRDANTIANPEIVDLAVGNYNYACTSSATQNYTSASITSSLNVGKASPIIKLLLNNAESDISVNQNDEVNITSILLSPSGEILNLTLDGAEIQSGTGVLTNLTSFSSGSHIVSSSYKGNSNYTSGSIFRIINIQSIVIPPSSGGGGGGGGGVFPSINKTQLNITFADIGEVIMSPGESKTIDVNSKNTGNTFLNKCKLVPGELYKSWFSNSDIKNINVGEITDFILKITAPIDSKDVNPKINLECLEKSFSIPLKVTLLNTTIRAEITNIESLNGMLLVNYSLIGNSESNHDLTFKVFDSQNTLVSEKTETIKSKIGTEQKSNLLDIKNAKTGMLKVSITEGNRILVEEFFIYSKSKGITGFTLLENINGSYLFITIITIITLVISFFIVRRIVRMRNNISPVVNSNRLDLGFINKVNN